MEQSIFAQIRREARDFFDSFISPVPGYSFNQYETIKLCHLYHNSKYEDSTQYLGRDKLFFNIVNPPCEVATKMLNVDTKNIRLLPMNSKSYFASYLLEKELREWLKMSEMGAILNQIAEEAPIYGSVVLEKTPKGAQVVDIRRLMNDPSVESIEDSRFITTVHYMTPSELRATNWDNVDVAIERFGNMEAAKPFEDNRGDVNQQISTPYIKVYKRYGEVPQWWLDGGRSEKMTRAVFIVAGCDELEKNAEGKEVGELGVILFSSKWAKEYPFRDFHYTRVKGRWLGVGVIEMLLDTQVRINELKSQKRVAMEVGTLNIFQTPDKQIFRNILTDLEPGDMVISKNGITPIATEMRDLRSFQDEEASYAQQADRLTFAYDAIRGEAPPSSTPLGTTQIVTAQSSSVFAFKRENLALFLREFFNELVMPQLIRDLDAEHIMRFTGSAQELLKIDQAAAEIYANDLVKKAILEGDLVTLQGIELQKEEYMQKMKKTGTNRFLQIKKSFYKDAEYNFDYIIDNEQVDPQVLATNIKSILADLSSNPAILQDPRLKLLYFKYAEKLGVNPAELEMADNQAQELQAKQEQDARAESAANPAGIQGTGREKQTVPVATQ